VRRPLNGRVLAYGPSSHRAVGETLLTGRLPLELDRLVDCQRAISLDGNDTEVHPAPPGRVLGVDNAVPRLGTELANHSHGSHSASVPH
jgi:hypothetical protein